MNEKKITDFMIIERASVKVLECGDGSCRPATTEEIILSAELTRLREELERMRESYLYMISEQGGLIRKLQNDNKTMKELLQGAVVRMTEIIDKSHGENGVGFGFIFARNACKSFLSSIKGDV